MEVHHFTWQTAAIAAIGAVAAPAGDTMWYMLFS